MWPSTCGDHMSDGLRDLLQATWKDQVATGFVLGDPSQPVESRIAPDPISGVDFRFRWLPHREIRTDPAELERLGILSPDCFEADLYRDHRDESGRHCFLCPCNVVICHPMETLVPVVAGGKQWYAGANFAWLASDHFTLMTERHEDQIYSPVLLEAMLDISEQTGGVFRVVFNGGNAGATIPWHLHLHVSSDRMPVETLRPGMEHEYPTPVAVFPLLRGNLAEADKYITEWEERDTAHHRVNLLVATVDSVPTVFVFLRDTRFTVATNKGLMGGWEVAGDFAYSEPGMRSEFESASLETVKIALAQIRPQVLRDR